MKTIAIFSALYATASAEVQKVEFTSTYEYNSSKANVTENVYSNPETNTIVKEMRRKYSDYFYYTLKARNITNDQAEGVIADCSTNQECDNSGVQTQCCVNSVMKHPATGT